MRRSVKRKNPAAAEIPCRFIEKGIPNMANATRHIAEHSKLEFINLFPYLGITNTP
jgi:hypothetical protein